MLQAGKRRFLIPFMLLLLAVGALPVAATGGGGITYESVCPTVIPGGSASGTIPGPDIATAIALSLIALDLAFDIVAIGYIVARAFNLRGMFAWVQGEYYELTKSIFLVIAIYGVLAVVSGLAIAIAPTATPTSGTLFANVGSLITSSESYLCTAEQNMLPGWTFIGQAAIAIGLAQGTTVLLYLPIPIPIPFIGVGFSLNSGFSANPYQNFMLESGNIVIQHFESIVFDMVQFVLFPVTSMLDVLITLLPLIVGLGLSVFIPMGLVMRAFPFIRGIGGTLIAIGVAASIIFPATLVLLDQPVAAWAAAMIPPPCGTGTLSCPPQACNLGVVMCTSFMGALGAVLSTGSLTQIIAYAWDSFGGIYVFMNGLISTGWYATVQLILFVLDLVIIYPLTDSIAKMLGGTIRLHLGGKLKMA